MCKYEVVGELTEYFERDTSEEITDTVFRSDIEEDSPTCEECGDALSAHEYAICHSCVERIAEEDR